MDNIFYFIQIYKTINKNLRTYSIEYEVRQIFKTSTQALKWEERVLRKMNAMHDPRFLNANIGGYKFRCTPESARQSAYTRKGKKLSPEHCKAISESTKGIKKTLSIDQRKKLSNNMRINPPAKGIKRSNEFKNKISTANRGRVWLTNGIVNKRVTKEHAAQLQQDGWYSGRILEVNGSKNGNFGKGRKICVNNTEYASIRIASDILNITRDLIQYRCKSSLPQWSNWVFVN